MASSSSSLRPENALTGRQKAFIDHLVHGRDFTIQLQALLSSTDLNDDEDNGFGSIKAEDLVSKIMASFTNTLFMLDKNDNFITTTSNNNNNDNENDRRFLVDSQGPKSEDSEESCRSVSTVVNHKDRRGCYKRRKTSNSWKRETPTLIDDGHAWRKYGQKAILKTKYPRNYFRCTHKYDQKCAAIKHVQQIQEEPPIYRTTYYGNHTCRNILTSPELVLDCTSPTQNSNNSMILSFNLASKQSHNPFISSPSFSTTTSVKQEFKDETIATILMPYSNNDNAMNNRSSDFVLLPDRDQGRDLPGFDHGSMLSSNDLASHDIHGDVISGVFLEAFEDDVLQHMDFN